VTGVGDRSWIAGDIRVPAPNRLPATGYRLPATGYRLSVTATDVASVSPMRESTRTR
jgi:hypothetical protein